MIDLFLTKLDNVNQFIGKIKYLFGDNIYRTLTVLEDLDYITVAVRDLFDKYCPYKRGDLVKLNNDVDVKDSSSWYCFKHLLVKDSIAVVKYTDWSIYQKDFVVYLEFVNETCKFKDAVIQVSDQEKHLFAFLSSEVSPV